MVSKQATLLSQFPFQNTGWISNKGKKTQSFVHFLLNVLLLLLARLARLFHKRIATNIPQVFRTNKGEWDWVPAWDHSSCLREVKKGIQSTCAHSSGTGSGSQAVGEARQGVTGYSMTFAPLNKLVMEFRNGQIVEEPSVKQKQGWE